MNSNAQEEMPLLKSGKNGKESLSITCLWNQQKNGPYFKILLIFFNSFTSMVLFSHFGPPGGQLRGLWGPWLSCGDLLGPHE